MLSLSADTEAARAPGAVTARAARQTRLLVVAGLAVLFTYVFLANSWVGDDAYITFRVVDNLIHGFGLRWNVVERVQTFTDPLWLFAMTPVYFICGNMFYAALLLSYALDMALLLMAVRHVRRSRWLILLVVFWLSSKAFVDYTSSGLEYPLSYFLLAVFAFNFAEDFDAGRHLQPRRISLYFVMAALAFVTRMDSLLLYLPALVYLSVASLRQDGWWPAVRRILVSISPALAWVLFAFVYYGFIFPNTYYAKVAIGIPKLFQIRMGLAYLANSVHFDPITLGVVAVAVVAGWRTSLATRLEAIGLVLTVVYVVWVGGDFMSGRFFTLAFLLATIMIVPRIEDGRIVTALVGALVLYNVIIPTVPIKTTASYTMAWPWRTQNGIKDERGGYHQATNVLFYDPLRTLPDHVWVREGQSDRDNPTTHVFEAGSIGFIGYYAGPGAYIIDTNALSDPMLARLPVSEAIYFDFNISHFYRPIPAGYVESRKTGTNQLTDPLLRDFYDRLTDVTSGPILSWHRLHDILLLNLGRYRNFHEMVRAERPLDVGVRATNVRFSTDAGTVDRRADVLRTTGRAGYLELGPRIPMSAGVYTVRWYGTASPGAGSSVIGSVRACYDDCRRTLAVADVVPPPAPRADKVIAQMTFRVPRDVGDLEYRFFANAGASVSLEHIRLTREGRIVVR